MSYKIYCASITMMLLLLSACSDSNVPEKGKDDPEHSTNPQEISCDPQILEFDIKNAESQTITLSAQSAWSATTNVDWLTIEPTSGQGSSFVKITCSNGQPAEGKIIFGSNANSAILTVRRIDKWPGSFSVSKNKKVYFSKGNLQYQASTNTWRFAEHQYDYIGEPNKNISSTYRGWIDLFNWGTSGYGVKPYSSTGYYSGDADITGTNYDWGYYNAISNAENMPGQWRILTNVEWYYLPYKSATVNGIAGCIIFPDDWITPSEIVSDQKVFTLANWERMEQAGAIFLPRAGARVGTEYKPNFFEYWTGSRPISAGTGGQAYMFDYQGNYGWKTDRDTGLSVRLVKDVE